MELLLSDEQKLLRDSAVTLVERSAGPKRVRELRDNGEETDLAAWRDVANAGWLGILAGEDAGGLALGMTELALVVEQAGCGLMAAPIAAAAVAARALGDSDSATLRDEIAPAIIAGELIVAAAFQEQRRGVELGNISTTASADGTGLRLSGRKTFIRNPGAIDGYLINAAGPEGPVLCYVAGNADGVALDIAANNVDGGSTGTLKLDGAQVAQAHILAGPNRAPGMTGEIHDQMLLGLGAELLGVMEQALNTTIEYLKIREQFDRPIGSFQALQHRAVNDYVDVETTRSLLYQVCGAADNGRGSSAMASAVKAKASGAALSVTKSAIQMHGAIGFTDEHDIGLHLKRAMALSAAYGNEAAHRARFARLSDSEPSAT
ncbi:MAG: acyl-CoA dehydrogenase [Rhodospirillales bacterium]|nr:acyl-CoA dehydrogenase [Rhodospirillales bacterium]